MKPVKTLLLSTLSLFLVHTTVAESTVLQEGSNDLRASALQKAPEGPLANLRRERVSFSTQVTGDIKANEPAEFVATSREYRTLVSASDLQKGVTITTTGAGAVVALSPLSAVKGAGLSPLDISIRTPEGTTLRGSDGMDQLVDQAAIQATGVPFSNGMVGFRLNRTLGSGTFTIATEKSASSQYQLHVLDARGSAQLSLGTQGQVLVGNAFEARGTFSDTTATTLKSVNAFLLSPGGERIAAKATIDASAFTVVSTANAPSSFNDGLWELHVSAQDVRGVQRDVKTAFAAAYSTARFDGSVEHTGASFALGVEAASSGRYEASAVLYGTSPKGLVPVARSATAQWLERGASMITLDFDMAHVKAAGASAPFVLRSVTLKDQSRMALLERISNGT